MNDAWGTAQNLGPLINSDANDHCPFVTPDGYRLILASNRAGGFGMNDLYMSFRRNDRDDLGWESPMNQRELNTASDEFGPWAFEHSDTGLLTLFLNSDRPGGLGGPDIYTSTLQEDGRFAPPIHVPELSSSASDIFSVVRADGLEIFIGSNRTGTVGAQDLWVATRSSLTSRWSTPANLGPSINSAANDLRPSISLDGRRIVFFSNRPGGLGGNDLYETTRRTMTLIPVVGTVVGAFGTTFRTVAQISNPSGATISGTMVFHPAGRSAASTDPVISYNLAPFATRTFTDLAASFGTSGLGSLDVLPATGATPVVSVRIEDGGFISVPEVRGEDVLTGGSHGVLVSPSDVSQFRFNIGVRTLALGAIVTIALYDSAGSLVRAVSRTFGPHYFAQTSAADLLGGSVEANQSIVFTVESGSVIVYGSTVSNTTQTSTLQMARRATVR